MDPITATTTVITLATFIKDLIEVGQSIAHSIEKVSENRRQLRDLTHDILRSLADIANLTRGCEDEYMAPALLGALGDLKADMLHVLAVCRDINLTGGGRGLRILRSQLKLWMKRDKIENEIRKLRQHVMGCFIKFTAFSTARNEHNIAHVEEMAFTTVNTTVRIEQTVVVNHVENQVRLHRLEGMMARVLREDPFGQDIMNRTMEIISSDTARLTLESQYLSVQTMHLIDRLRMTLASKSMNIDPDESPFGPPQFMQPISCNHLLYQILGMILLCDNEPTQVRLTDIDFSIGVHLGNLGRKSEAVAWHSVWNVEFKHWVELGWAAQPQILRIILLMQHNLSHEYQHQMRHDLALQTSEEALQMWRSSEFAHCRTDLTVQGAIARIAIRHCNSLLGLKLTHRFSEAVTVAQEAVALSRSLVTQHTVPTAISRWTPEEWMVYISSSSLFVLGRALASTNRHKEAIEASTEAIKIVLPFSGSIHYPPGYSIDGFIHQLCTLAETEEMSLPVLAATVILFRDLAHCYPEVGSSIQFLHLIQAYMYISQQKTQPDSAGTSMENLRMFLEPQWRFPAPSLETNFPLDFCQGVVIKDVIQMYLNTENRYLTSGNHLFIQDIFHWFHANEGATMLRDALASLIMDSDSTTPNSKDYLERDEVVAELAEQIISHYAACSDNQSADGQEVLLDMLMWASWCLSSAGFKDISKATHLSLKSQLELS
ncbi:hypothetical protein FB45DRAFT_890854, partial [Roridomyces roridus]